MNAQEQREAILEGVSAAASLHERLSLRERLADGRAPVDVFEILNHLGVPTLCRPLDRLLGAFLPDPLFGIVVTTRRDLHVQRYTAAHELGHYLLDHSARLDDEGSVGFLARGEMHRDPREVAADSFASELLAPRWLVTATVDRQEWTASQLREPGIVYQLSLRLGISYVAACWCLASHQALERSEATELAKIPPKVSKQEALGGMELDNPWADVWTLTDRDAGLVLVGSPDDVVRIQLTEHGAAGSTWDVAPLVRSGLELLADEQTILDGDSIGGNGARSLKFRGEGAGRFRLEERRQWDESSPVVASFEIEFSLSGKEVGMPRSMRRRLH